MPVKSDCSSLLSKARRIAEAWGFDYDKENLFPANTLPEEWEEAAEKDVVVLPQRTLRDRSHAVLPLRFRPDYKGDFLEQLKQDDMNRSAENLFDITCPGDWLKYLPETQPRDLRDDFYEVNRLDSRYPTGPGAYDVMKEYHDHGWDEEDAPEWSEDKILRMRKPKIPPSEPCKCRIFHASVERVINRYVEQTDHFRAGMIVARHLMEVLPVEYEYDPVPDHHLRVSKYLHDLSGALIHGRKKMDVAGVQVRMVRAEPRVGRWTFATGHGYTTIFQFIPQAAVRDTEKLHVRVSCTCPSWVWWGAQYHAVMDGYLYGKIKLKFSPPKKRDPEGTFLVCKHVLACIPIVSKYKLQEVIQKVKTRLQKAPKIEIDTTGFKEKIRIPSDLAGFARRPDIKEAVRTWNAMTDEKRREFIMGLDSPGAVAFMAHRFPETASEYVVEKLRDLSLKSRLSSFRDWAKRLLKDII